MTEKEDPFTTVEAPPLAPVEPERPLPAFPFLALGGIFMGLANIVPGISGGTMILVLGLYEEFIESVAKLTRPATWTFFLKGEFWGAALPPKPGRLKEVVPWRPFYVLGMVVVLAAVAILFCAGIVHSLLESYRPEMMGLFIGLTLGGVPLLWREMKGITPGGIIGALAGLLFMLGLAFGLDPSLAKPSWIMLLFGGVAGSAAMILPGLSGSYVLLIMGLYTPIIFGVSEFKTGLKEREISLIFETGFGTLFPVALGLVLGIGVLSNVLKSLLNKAPNATLGFLMGLLIGSLAGLYPFKTQSLGKLQRYAVGQAEEQVVEGTQIRSLTIFAGGWQDTEENPVASGLMASLPEDIDLKIEPRVDQDWIPELVHEARDRQAVMIAYDFAVSPEVRREAAREDDEAGIEEVPLLILSNVEASPTRIGVVAGLGAVGFILVMLLSALEGSQRKKRETEPAETT